jgi:Protein of Unknown function (DUF2784)
VLFRILADATVVVHLLFVLFAVLGGILVARWWWVAWAHVPAAIWGAWVEFAGWQCPLTPLENWFRQQGSREVQWTLGGLVVLLNAAIYVLILRRRARP